MNNSKQNYPLIYYLALLCSLGMSAGKSLAHDYNGYGETGRKKKDPVVTYTPADSTPDMPVAPSGEVYLPPTIERIQLHALHHDFLPLITATLPPIFEPPEMNKVSDFVTTKKNMVVVNPAPEEFLWIMEGKRRGFENLSIVLTNTLTGNGAPLHTHVGEEAHVLLEGKMRYFLGDKVFTVKAPYIVNIPPMTPHAFMNVDPRPAKLIGIFPNSNHWEYDILDGDPFAGHSDVAEQFAPMHADARERTSHLTRLNNWYSPKARLKRLLAYEEKTGNKVIMDHTNGDNEELKH